MLPWLRYYSETLEDPKVQLLPAVTFKRWVNLLCLANRGQPRGLLPDAAGIAYALRLTLQVTTDLLADLLRRELLDETPAGLKPHKWDKRQPEWDDVNQRVKRNRQRKDYGTSTVLEVEGEVDEIRTEEKRGERDVARSASGYVVPPDLLTRWQVTYPGVDVLAQVRAAFEWEQANPERQKINLRAFLVNWLKREQDHNPRPKVVAVAVQEKIRPAILDAPPPEFRPMPEELRQSIATLARGMKMP